MKQGYFFLLVSILIIILGVSFSSGCRKVNKERAYEYYDKNVKNFPETNE